MSAGEETFVFIYFNKIVSMEINQFIQTAGLSLRTAANSTDSSNIY